ncbi:Tfp pilus assembly protein FimT/FimU [Vibrio gallaecicus]|uniref:pilus assembly FimT family protein n=1 Tax=Vibrio gallaecicus TaxID=552386 RepID=UPI0010C9912F|nr:prepilin-type N-terminal cleavage/methylation domain-containing protein [Vibrio gallaecicus]MDN3614260.1 prepilin-type N-terminal cleavage/methylation domain-containing protein [Vibrio gallaecicus]
MSRGFTFLELLITISVLSILLAVAAPSFSSVSETVKMKRLASEIHSFLITSRSEAVFRNQELFLHFRVGGASGPLESSTGDWKLILTSSTPYVVSDELLHIDGSSYEGIKVIFNFQAKKIVAIDAVRGRLSNGNVEFAPDDELSKKIFVKASETTGRVRVCSVDPNSNERNSIGYFGYEIC